jgi:hypothetical protein
MELAVQSEASGLSPPNFVEVKLSPQSALSPSSDSDTQLHIDCVAGIRITAGGNYPIDKLVKVIREVVQPC